MSAWQDRVRGGWPLALAALLVVGAGLRLVWNEDIEYKLDEAWTYETAAAVRSADRWPWLGMESSTKAPNPGMSLWVFVALSRLSGADDPPSLARAVQVLNIAALLGLVVFAYRVVPAAEREPWLWAAALVAINPFTVLFQRKIWPPSVFPLVSLIVLAGWWRRDRRGWACIWGLVGACLGQIHMSGFFFAAGLAGWAALFDRQRVVWRAWFVGCCVGLVPLVPWLVNVVTESGGRAVASRKFYHIFEMKFWTQWTSEALGLTPQYVLGNDFADFMRYPVVAGQPTYFVAAAHLLCAAVGAVIGTRGVPVLWRNRQHWRAVWIGSESTTAFTLSASLWGFGLLLTLTGSVIHRHYILVVFPLTFVWVARLALGRMPSTAGRGLLTTLCIAQLIVSASLLSYIHVNRRPIRGEYGTPYCVQEKPLNPYLASPSAEAGLPPTSPAVLLRTPPPRSKAD